MLFLSQAEQEEKGCPFVKKPGRDVALCSFPVKHSAMPRQRAE